MTAKSLKPKKTIEQQIQEAKVQIERNINVLADPARNIQNKADSLDAINHIAGLIIALSFRVK